MSRSRIQSLIPNIDHMTCSLSSKNLPRNTVDFEAACSVYIRFRGVNGYRWGDTEDTLHVRLGGRDAVDLRVIVDECEELTLPRGKVSSHGVALSSRGTSPLGASNLWSGTRRWVGETGSADLQINVRNFPWLVQPTHLQHTPQPNQDRLGGVMPQGGRVCCPRPGDVGWWCTTRKRSLPWQRMETWDVGSI